ncbi:hypothetical protein PCANC_25207 [Puccinia coronata f. sp. avenae]|uniref:MnmG N-terminal domain-containing protein n=1 Tax=Puccinia coronata f. sp. avenae TaxID=200324 RepID=A0A2N5TXM3_9BASI|nr:hypothetical protein PCANC_25207 [Puccinia coronata f. sp. avenae]
MSASHTVQHLHLLLARSNLIYPGLWPGFYSECSIAQKAQQFLARALKQTEDYTKRLFSDRSMGLKLETGETLHGKAVVTAAVTFLGGEIRIGRKTCGRIGERSSTSLSNSRRCGFKLPRMKTGAPPRPSKRSINFQNLDVTPKPFSFFNKTARHADQQLFGWKTQTTKATHEFVPENLHPSSYVREEVRGPRYCPSLEVKVAGLSQRDEHMVWLEPRGFLSELSGFLSELSTRPAFPSPCLKMPSSKCCETLLPSKAWRWCSQDRVLSATTSTRESQMCRCDRLGLSMGSRVGKTLIERLTETVPESKDLEEEI